jgi:hypothetical protein
MDIPRPSKSTSTPVPQEPSRVVQFVKYNNTIPIVLGVIFLGTTGAMAATPEVRNAVYTSSAQTVSIDNSRILSVDVDSYPLSVQIRTVTEDAEKYYVKYTLTTLALVDGVWTDSALSKELVVYKSALAGRDLGTYVSAELAEVREYERRLLAETQSIERTNGLSQKIVATTYAGLVGKYLSPSEEVISGYTPVIAEAGTSAPEGSDPNRLANPIAAPTFDANSSGGLAVGGTQAAPQGTTGSGAGDSVGPEVSLLGESPAYVAVGGSYTDLGVAATDNVSRTLRLRRFLNNTEVSTIQISTATEGTYSIRYLVTDEAGNSTERVRSVIVQSASSAGGGGSTEPTPDPTPAPAPDPSPSPEPAPEPTPTPDPEPTPDPGPAPDPSPSPSGGESGGGDAPAE